MDKPNPLKINQINRYGAVAQGRKPVQQPLFINVTSSQKKTLPCGMIKPQSINKKEVANMIIKLNPDQEIVNMKRNMAFRWMEIEADPGWGGLYESDIFLK